MDLFQRVYTISLHTQSEVKYHLVFCLEVYHMFHLLIDVPGYRAGRSAPMAEGGHFRYINSTGNHAVQAINVVGDGANIAI